ncbi:transcriptional regulator family: C2H2 zinc finger [Purpureocillium lilacinum]|uniref:Transcriptional regulator family: C2H2 zinc finger n=1 Tax=Purpureocillium lilacinum TaxID=33203 RepID=A0ABR0BEJ4_PURLI|nr:transcriptional regulator family: C2H2 zinc finger [Purpureocillium lilacinum]
MPSTSGAREESPPLQVFRARFNPSPSPPPGTCQAQAKTLRSRPDATRPGDKPGTDDPASLPAFRPNTKATASDIKSPAGAFICLADGCTAMTFKTQAHLNSHSAVHSPTYTWHCSVPGCSESFKRKSDMDRHGRSHDSPRYRCPYCIEIDHPYARLDNLLRHVQNKHPNIRKDDTVLLQVLSPRRKKGRQKRTGAGNP